LNTILPPAVVLQDAARDGISINELVLTVRGSAATTEANKTKAFFGQLSHRSEQQVLALVHHLLAVGHLHEHVMLVSANSQHLMRTINTVKTGSELTTKVMVSARHDQLFKYVR
jgi:methyl-accepting chemotaxis protein